MAKKRKAKKGKIKRKRTAKKNNPKKRSPRKPVPRAIAKSEKEKAKVNFSLNCCVASAEFPLPQASG